MKKNIKKQGKRAKAEQAKEQKVETLSELGERPAKSLMIGVDLGDKNSTYTVRNRDAQEILLRGSVATEAAGVLSEFQKLQPQTFILETGTHARWMSQLLEAMGHEVVVANARKLKLISENNTKSDKVDPDLLSSLGCMNPEWLHPVYQRSQGAHNDLTMVKAREVMVKMRTEMINFVRGTVKAFGCRIGKCDSEHFVEVAKEQVPKAMQPALSGVLATLAEVNEQIYEYDRHIEHVGQTRYQEQTRWVLQVNGVGPITALTFVLTIEDPGRFESSRDVGPYLGLTASKRQSGKQNPQLGISKAGDELLRKLLVNCAHHILGFRGEDSDLRRWGLKLVENGLKAGQQGARNRAATAVARKLAVLLHVLWAKKVKYEPLRNSQAAKGTEAAQAA
jgi:transposase